MATRVILVVLASITASCIAQATWNVGNSGTRGGNAPGQRCSFPFIYNGQTYQECTTSRNDKTPWCSTTPNYDTTRQWSNCEVTIKANRTKSGNAERSNCFYPFIYKGQQYNECITADYATNKPWCATSDNFDRDHQWAECIIYPKITTTGGNAPQGSECIFPFRYRNYWHYGCTDYHYQQNKGWCATTSDYNKDRIWGDCVQTIIDDDNNNNNNGGNPNCPNGHTYANPVTNTLSYGGIGQQNANSRSACRALCSCRDDCIGFDFDYNTDERVGCFIHRRGNTEWNTKRSASRVDQYRVTRSCSTNNCNNTPNPGTGLVQTRGGNNQRQGFCTFPFIYGGYRYTSCISHYWYGPWCAETNNYDRDRLWGECINIPVM